MIFPLLFHIFILAFSSPPVLILNVQPAVPGTGQICVAVYENDDTFMNEAASVFARCYPAQNEAMQQIRIPGLHYGTYAIAVMQDVNNDDKLNKNLLGVPKEPYGFSNNIVSKWSPPRFEEAEFAFAASEQQLSVVLKYWREY